MLLDVIMCLQCLYRHLTFVFFVCVRIQEVYAKKCLLNLISTHCGFYAISF